MATAYKTPGVYIEEIAKLPPSVAQVETAIPVFIGKTEKGDQNKLVRIQSMAEFIEKFGSAPEETINVTLDEYGKVTKVELASGSNPSIKLYYTVFMFYSNGGGVCYIFNGNWEDAEKELLKNAEPTLIVMPCGEYNNYKSALQHCESMQNRFVIMDTMVESNADESAKKLRDGISGNIDQLKYGAAYFPYLNTTIVPPNYKVVVVSPDFAKLADEAKTKADDAQKAADDAHADAETDATKKANLQTIAEEAKTKAEEAKKKAEELKINLTVEDGRPKTGSSTNTLTQQVLTAINKEFGLVLPPSGAIAGLYARVDRTRGVWKAPANETLFNVKDVTYHVTNADNAGLNVDSVAGKSINVIRTFPGRGLLVWGARTLAGNDNEWRYVSVRRFYIMAEQSIKNATERFVFEPNDANTWVKVKAMIENYLTILWRQGALAGAKPEDAFYVKVGLHQTMTAIDILEGRMIVEVGMAVVRPAEFIILQFSHKMQES
ncbi:MAG TPA: phage tail sheath subtilisin-like domain-containing protein [Chitinophagales bacterium]|nr:phage tail sheath subtilisin-like domain-containing protein [Chitinophagales bacterium]HRK26891.1 phage tail sheath subtilisin-like domain-containing protein [Chitinophagales bacterium]